MNPPKIYKGQVYVGWMRGILYSTFLQYKVKVGFPYRVLQSPLFAHVLCNELVTNKGIEVG